MVAPNPTVKANSFIPLKDNIFVVDLEGRVQRTKAGIIIPDDNMKEHGIKPRWGKVWRVGPDVSAVLPGEWVLVEHGRWTAKISLELADEKVDVWKIDPAAILLVSSEEDRPTETVEHSF